MDERKNETMRKEFISILKKTSQQRIIHYTKPFTEPDAYTDWIRLYQGN